MSNSAVRIERLSKQYRVGASGPGYRTFREAITDLTRIPFRHGRRRRSRSSQESHIWALRDIDLEVQNGEVVGVIGRNGAGKSTLLKILSRITEPTSGRI